MDHSDHLPQSPRIIHQVTDLAIGSANNKSKISRVPVYSLKESRGHVIEQSSQSDTSHKITQQLKKLGQKKDRKLPPSTASGGVPEPTRMYLNLSSETPAFLHEPKHLLVVIDLNGTLLHRPNKNMPTKFVVRPHTQRFLQYCVDTFTVVIWSSAMPENVRNLCDCILTPNMKTKVAAIWGRDKFGLSSSDYKDRVQCYKRLTGIWSDAQIGSYHPQGDRWDQTNTVLIDDSAEKGRSEPYNLIEIPEFAGNPQEDGDILPQVHDFLNFLSLQSNVSACLRSSPFQARAGVRGP